MPHLGDHESEVLWKRIIQGERHFLVWTKNVHVHVSTFAHTQQEVKIKINCFYFKWWALQYRTHMFCQKKTQWWLPNPLNWRKKNKSMVEICEKIKRRGCMCEGSSVSSTTIFLLQTFVQKNLPFKWILQNIWHYNYR